MERDKRPPPRAGQGARSRAHRRGPEETGGVRGASPESRGERAEPLLPGQGLPRAIPMEKGPHSPRGAEGAAPLARRAIFNTSILDKIMFRPRAGCGREARP